MEYRLYEFLFLREKEDVAEERSCRIGQFDGIDPILCTFAKEIQGCNGGGYILPQLRQFSGEGCPERGVSLILPAHV